MKQNNNIEVKITGTPINNGVTDFLINSNSFIVREVVYTPSKTTIKFNFRVFGSVPHKSEKVLMEYTINNKSDELHRFEALYTFIKAQSISSVVKHALLKNLYEHCPLVPIYEEEKTITDKDRNIDYSVRQVLHSDFERRVLVKKTSENRLSLMQKLRMHWILTLMVFIDSVTAIIWFTAGKDWNVNVWGVIGLAVIYTTGGLIWYFLVMLSVIAAKRTAINRLKFVSIDIKKQLYKNLVDIKEYPELTIETYPLLVSAFSINIEQYVLGAIYRLIPHAFDFGVNLEDFAYVVRSA